MRYWCGRGGGASIRRGRKQHTMQGANAKGKRRSQWLNCTQQQVSNKLNYRQQASNNRDRNQRLLNESGNGCCRCCQVRNAPVARLTTSDV